MKYIGKNRLFFKRGDLKIKLARVKKRGDTKIIKIEYVKWGKCVPTKEWNYPMDNILTELSNFFIEKITSKKPLFLKFNLLVMQSVLLIIQNSYALMIVCGKSSKILQ